MKVFYITKIELGLKVEDLSKYLTQSEIEDLSSSKELSFSSYNKKYFTGTDLIKLDVAIKNIPQINVKVFEFCPENYYLKENREIEGTMNLDGLITAEEYNHDFNEPTGKRLIKTFSFDSIQQKERGIFIIDMVGNGMSARAVIRKGKLSLLEKSNVAGQAFFIVDENKNICKGGRTGLWIKGKFYEADKRGEIFIDYSSSGAGSNKTVLVHNDFAELTDIDIKGESYEFKCAYLYTEETFLMGNKARILI